MEAQVPREDGNPPPLEQEVTIPEGVPKENVYSQSLTGSNTDWGPWKRQKRKATCLNGTSIRRDCISGTIDPFSTKNQKSLMNHNRGEAFTPLPCSETKAMQTGDDDACQRMTGKMGLKGVIEQCLRQWHT